MGGQLFTIARSGDRWIVALPNGVAMASVGTYGEAMGRVEALSRKYRDREALLEWASREGAAAPPQYLRGIAALAREQGGIFGDGIRAAEGRARDAAREELRGRVERAAGFRRGLKRKKSGRILARPLEG
jgi:hypothetical protein